MTSRSTFARIIVSVVSVLLMLSATASQAHAQKRGTSVGQINGTPSGTPNATVRLEAGLSVSPGNSVGYWRCLPGTVRVFYASGNRWIYIGQANATGCFGVPNSYARAVFNFRIPSNVRRNAHLRLRYEYPGNNWYHASVGYGNVYVR